MFRIINMFNKNADPTALQALPTIYKTIDLKNISRLKNTRDSLELAILIYNLINMRLIIQTKKDYKHHQQQNRKNAKQNKTSKEEIKKAFAKQENFLKGNVS